MIEKDIERIAVASERIAAALESLVGGKATVPAQNAVSKGNEDAAAPRPAEAAQTSDRDTEKARRQAVLAELTAMKVAFDKKQPTSYLEKVLAKAKEAAPATEAETDPFAAAESEDDKQLDFLGNPEEEAAPKKERAIFSYEAVKSAAIEFIKRYGDTEIKKVLAEIGKTKLPDLNDEERTDFVEKINAIAKEKELAKAGASTLVKKAR